jgi:predicted flap endonuclease-1-like 5' DNA nuclease
MRIEDVEGIGPAYREKLKAAGVASTDALLDAAGRKGQRARLAAETGISEKLLLEWVNHADLMRIDGVGSEFADLLEAGGVDSCAELAQRNAATLSTTFGELDAARNTTRQLPSAAVVQGWIDQARRLDRVVEH